MASGYGLSGGPGRCFPFWQEVLACYVVNSDSEDNSGAKKCVPALDDYMECLHHTKERQRIANIQRAYRKAIAKNPREHMPSAEQIRNLGVLGKEEDTEAVLSTPGPNLMSQEAKDKLETIKQRLQERMEQQQQAQATRQK